jgi:predicted TIM-barrel enzyme
MQKVVDMARMSFSRSAGSGVDAVMFLNDFSLPYPA